MSFSHLFNSELCINKIKLILSLHAKIVHASPNLLAACDNGCRYIRLNKIKLARMQRMLYSQPKNVPCAQTFVAIPPYILSCCS